MYRTLILQQTNKNTIASLYQEFNSIQEDGSAFCIISSEYDSSGNVLFDFLDIIEQGIAAGYEYVNTIVYPIANPCIYAFRDNVKYVVWLCKNKKLLHFNKDAIREKHIWKDVEWGKRKKNYNPKGKDPGNVWIPTEDDGKGTITKHIMLSNEDVIKRIINMTDAHDSHLIKTDTISNNSIEATKNNIIKEKRKYEIPGLALSGKIVFGSSESMDEISDNSVALAVTSPPYWDLKDYFKEGQIGQEPYDVYLSRLGRVWEECHKKLKSTGSLWINVNIRSKYGNTILIPKDIVKSCQEIGFYYKGIVIWHKSSGIPTNSKNIVDRYEYVLVFSKDKHFQVEMDVFSSFSDYKNEAINGGAFWNINRKAGSVGKKYIHPAIYPNQLVERIALCSTKEGDIVLDPFVGSGTSLISSFLANRSFIGYEYNEKFKELMVSRFAKEIPDHLDLLSFVYK